MGGGDLNTKKSWHPNTFKNQERVWKVEQAAKNEKKRIEELQKEYRSERDREDLQALGQRMGTIEKNESNKLDWMYNQPNKAGNADDYLLGKEISVNYEKLLAEEKQAEIKNQLAPKNHVEHECIPFSIRNFRGQNSIPAKEAQVDMQRKMQEDPLTAIKKRELESRAKLLQNPVRLQQIKRMLEQDQAIKEKKKKKSSSDLDKILAEKLSKLTKGKGKKVDLLSLLSKKKKKKHSSDDSSSESSDSSSESNDSSSDSKHSKDDFSKRIKPDQDRRRNNERLNFRTNSNDRTKQKHKTDRKDDKGERNYRKSKKRRHSQSSDDIDVRRDIKEKHHSSKKSDKVKRSCSPESRSERSRANFNEFRLDSRKMPDQESSKKSRKKYFDQLELLEFKSSNRKKSGNDNDTNEKRASEKVDKDEFSIDSHKGHRTDLSYDSGRITQRSSSKIDKDEFRVHSRRSRSLSSNDDRGRNRKKSSSKVEHESKNDYRTHKNSDRYKRSSTPESDEDLCKRKFYGLVGADGKNLEIKKYDSKAKSESKKPEKKQQYKKPERKQLSEEEKDRLRREMMSNALVRDKERKSNVEKYKEQERREESKGKQEDFDKEFVNKQLRKSTNAGTVEGRIKSNIYNIQRSKGDMDSNFVKR